MPEIAEREPKVISVRPRDSCVALFVGGVLSRGPLIVRVFRGTALCVSGGAGAEKMVLFTPS